MRKLYDSAEIKNARTARILVLGLPGSGKSTLAKRLITDHGIRHIECDRFFHRPDFISAIEDEIQSDGFVIEGHFKDLKDLLTKQPWTHVIWLDPPYWMTTWQLLTREWNKFGPKAFGAGKTFPFYLKNHQRLRSIQEKAFREFSKNTGIISTRLR